MARTTQSDGAKPVRLARDLRIAAAAATFRALFDACRRPGQIVSIDGRQVEKVDAAGLQAVLGGYQALQRAGKTPRWTGCSVQLTAAAGLLGLSETLELPQ